MPLNYRLLTIKEAAERLRKSEGWLRAKIRRGQGPKIWRTGGRSIEIRETDLDEWFNSSTEETDVKAAEKIVAKVKGLTETKQEVDDEVRSLKEPLVTGRPPKYDKAIG